MNKKWSQTTKPSKTITLRVSNLLQQINDNYLHRVTVINGKRGMVGKPRTFIH